MMHGWKTRWLERQGGTGDSPGGNIALANSRKLDTSVFSIQLNPLLFQVLLTLMIWNWIGLDWTTSSNLLPPHSKGAMYSL
eukprot:scaffold3471_cov87-Attheya_sp.AAC.4